VLQTNRSLRFVQASIEAAHYALDINREASRVDERRNCPYAFRITAFLNILCATITGWWPKERLDRTTLPRTTTTRPFQRHRSVVRAPAADMNLKQACQANPSRSQSRGLGYCFNEALAPDAVLSAHAQCLGPPHWPLVAVHAGLLGQCCRMPLTQTSEQIIQAAPRR